MSYTNEQHEQAEPSDGGRPGDKEHVIEPRPLTRRRVKGARKDELYTRRPAVEREIREMLRLTPTELSHRIRRVRYSEIENFRYPPPGFLKPETLVYSVRHHTMAWEQARLRSEQHNALAHRRAAGDAWEAVMAVGIRIIRRLLQGLPYGARERAEDEILELLNVLLPDAGPDGEYLEVSFGDMVKKRTMNARKRHLKSKDASEREREEPESGVESVAVDTAPDPFTHAMVENLKEILPDDVREPFVKRVFEDAPITHRDPKEESLVDQFEVSDKTISKRIAKATKILQELEDDERPDDA